MRWKIYFVLAALVCAVAGIQGLGAQAAPTEKAALAAQAAPAAQEQAPAEQAASDARDTPASSCCGGLSDSGGVR